MEADGEHNTRGTANTVTDGQRLDQLEDMVRELYRHVVGNEYSEGETPGPKPDLVDGGVFDVEEHWFQLKN